MFISTSYTLKIKALITFIFVLVFLFTLIPIILKQKVKNKELILIIGICFKNY